MAFFGPFKNLLTPEVETYRTTKADTTYTITRKGNMSFFKVNGMTYSQLDSKSLYTHSYHDKFLLLPLLYEKPRVLMIGLGAGTVPYQLSKLYPGISIDVVELNRDYAALTKRFLPKGPLRFSIKIGRGEEFVQNARSKYDIIMQDAYQDFHVPEVFLKDKFMEDAYRALTPNGILSINYAPEAIYLPIYMHNLSKYFRRVYRMKHISLGNYILICSKSMDKSQIMNRIMSRMKVDRENGYLLKAYKSMG